MSQVASISNTIQYGGISTYLASTDIATYKALSWGQLNNNLAKTISEVTKSVKWAYNNNSSNPTLVQTSEYLYSLLGKFLYQSISISGNSGGYVVGQSAGNIAIIQNYRVEFTVGQAGSLMTAGQTTLTISAANVLSNSANVYLDGSIMYANATDQATYSIVYSANSFTLSFNIDGNGGGVQNGQKFIIEYTTQSVSTSSNYTLAPLTPIDYTATGGETSITYTNLIGRTVILVFLGSTPSGQIITSGTPTGTQVLFNTATGTLTFVDALVAGEDVKIIYA